MIIALIRPSKWVAVREALEQIEVERMTVADALGFADSRQSAVTRIFPQVLSQMVWLEIIVNCVDARLAANNPYILSPNIVNLRVGEVAQTISATLVGGNPSDNIDFSWGVANGDSSIVTVHGNNETAQIRPVKEGVTQIIVSHPKTRGIPRTVLVIVQPPADNEYYINIAEPIIRMKPSDPARTITASLIGSTNPNDNYNFKWWADDYNIIQLHPSNNSAVITPITSGVAYVHVQHPMECV